MEISEARKRREEEARPRKSPEDIKRLREISGRLTELGVPERPIFDLDKWIDAEERHASMDCKGREVIFETMLNISQLKKLGQGKFFIPVICNTDHLADHQLVCQSSRDGRRVIITLMATRVERG